MRKKEKADYDLNYIIDIIVNKLKNCLLTNSCFMQEILIHT